MRLLVVKEFCDISSLTDLASGEEICLVAHPVFAAEYGIRYYLMARKKLQQQLPSHPIHLGIACGDIPGFALEAMAAKVDRLYFLKTSPHWPKIVSLCQQADILIFDQKELLCQL